VPRFVVLLTALLLVGCAVKPINPQTISGHYEMIGQPEGLWYAGESLTLHEDSTFQYSLYTALADDPRLAKYPVNGRYTLDGATLTLHHPAVLFPQRTIVHYHKLFALWSAKQREAYQGTGHFPDDVLLQKP